MRSIGKILLQYAGMECQCTVTISLQITHCLSAHCSRILLPKSSYTFSSSIRIRSSLVMLLSAPVPSVTTVSARSRFIS